MTREEVVNSFAYQAAKAGVEYYNKNLDQDPCTSFEDGAKWGYNNAIERACEWLNKNIALCIDYDDDGNLILDTKNFVDYFKMRMEQNQGK